MKKKINHERSAIAPKIIMQMEIIYDFHMQTLNFLSMF